MSQKTSIGQLNRTGVLSRLQIRLLSAVDQTDPLITRWSEEQGGPPAAYDLRVGHIIVAEQYLRWSGQPDNRQMRLLESGEVATLATYEELALPADVNGLIVPRDSWAKRGLLILNAGHIDPGYQGVVTAQVINMTDRPLPLALGTSYFSAIFSWVSDPDSDGDKARPNPEAYLVDLRMHAIERPLSFIHADIFKRTFVARDQLNYELLVRLVPFIVALIGAIAGILGVLQITGVL